MIARFATGVSRLAGRLSGRHVKVSPAPILTADEFRSSVLLAGPAELRQLVITQVIRREPFCFASDMSFYQEVRKHLAAGLKAEIDGIHLVGSGAAGFSLAPANFPRGFHSESDLDFAVVSEQLFDKAWKALLDWGHPQRHKVHPDDLSWFDDRTSEIFWGWLDPQYMRFRGLIRPRFLEGLRDLQHDWFDTFQSIGDAFPGTELARRKSSARLYRTEDHLIRYQAEGLRRLKNRLA